MMREPTIRRQLVPQCSLSRLYRRVHCPIVSPNEKQGVPKQRVKCLDQINLLFSFFLYLLIIVNPYLLAYLITLGGMSVILSSYSIESDRWRQHERVHFHIIIYFWGHAIMLLCQHYSLPQGMQQHVLDLIDLLYRVWASFSMPPESLLQINP